MILRSGAVVLRPLRRSDEDDWIVLRQRNQDWLARWEATRPPGSPEKAPTFAQMVRGNQRRARRGEILPWHWSGTMGGPIIRPGIRTTSRSLVR